MARSRTTEEMIDKKAVKLYYEFITELGNMNFREFIMALALYDCVKTFKDVDWKKLAKAYDAYYNDIPRFIAKELWID